MTVAPSPDPEEPTGPDEPAETLSETEPGPELLSSPEIRRVALDTTRRGVLFWALGLFTTVLIFGGAAAWKGHEVWGNVKDYLGMIMPILTGILGTVIGFYFGRRNRNTTNNLT